MVSLYESLIHVSALRYNRDYCYFAKFANFRVLQSHQWKQIAVLAWVVLVMVIFFSLVYTNSPCYHWECHIFSTLAVVSGRDWRKTQNEIRLNITSTFIKKTNNLSPRRSCKTSWCSAIIFPVGVGVSIAELGHANSALVTHSQYWIT